MISHIHRLEHGSIKELSIYLDESDDEDRDHEIVRLKIFDPIPDITKGSKYIEFDDDSGAQVTYLAEQIDDIIEALQDLKGEID